MSADRRHDSPVVASRRRFGRAVIGCVALFDGVALAKEAPPESERRAALQRSLDVERQQRGRADLCSNAIPGGAGLRGEHFALDDFAGACVADRVQSELAILPAGAARSVRWSGWLRAPLDGVYRFHANAPGVRLRVARRLVLAPAGEEQAPARLAAGRFHPIVIELAHIEPGLRAFELEWTAPHGARFAVPGRVLYPPSERVRS